MRGFEQRRKPWKGLCMSIKAVRSLAHFFGGEVGHPAVLLPLAFSRVCFTCHNV